MMSTSERYTITRAVSDPSLNVIGLHVAIRIYGMTEFQLRRCYSEVDGFSDEQVEELELLDDGPVVSGSLGAFDNLKKFAEREHLKFEVIDSRSKRSE